MPITKRIQNFLRQLFHDVYYWKAEKKRVEFALRCQEVAEHIDDRMIGLTPTRKMRVHLHLSLCQACANYNLISHALRRALKNYVQSESPAPSDELTQKLIEKYRKRD